MLDKIDPQSANEARRLLALLCAAPRPLTIPEVVDALAIELEAPAHFDPDKRLVESNDVLTICPGLVQIAWRDREGDVEQVSRYSFTLGECPR